MARVVESFIHRAPHANNSPIVQPIMLDSLFLHGTSAIFPDAKRAAWAERGFLCILRLFLPFSLNHYKTLIIIALAILSNLENISLVTGIHPATNQIKKMTPSEKANLTERIAAAEVILAPYYASLWQANADIDAGRFNSAAGKKSNDLTRAVYFARTGFANYGKFTYYWSGALSDAKDEVKYNQDTAASTVAALERIAEIAESLSAESVA